MRNFEENNIVTYTLTIPRDMEGRYPSFKSAKQAVEYLAVGFWNVVRMTTLSIDSILSPDLGDKFVITMRAKENAGEASSVFSFSSDYFLQHLPKDVEQVVIGQPFGRQLAFNLWMIREADKAGWGEKNYILPCANIHDDFQNCNARMPAYVAAAYSETELLSRRVLNSLLEEGPRLAKYALSQILPDKGDRQIARRVMSETFSINPLFGGKYLLHGLSQLQGSRSLLLRLQSLDPLSLFLVELSLLPKYVPSRHVTASTTMSASDFEAAQTYFKGNGEFASFASRTYLKLLQVGEKRIQNKFTKKEAAALCTALSDNRYLSEDFSGAMLVKTVMGVIDLYLPDHEAINLMQKIETLTDLECLFLECVSHQGAKHPEKRPELIARFGLIS